MNYHVPSVPGQVNSISLPENMNKKKRYVMVIGIKDEIANITEEVAPDSYNFSEPLAKYGYNKAVIVILRVIVKINVKLINVLSIFFILL